VEYEVFLQNDDAHAAAESARFARELADPEYTAPSPVDEYMDLLTFVERVAKARLEDTHASLIEEARRLVAAAEVADVHLDNECTACEGAGWFDDTPRDGEGNPTGPEDLEMCGDCNGTGEAVRRIQENHSSDCASWVNERCNCQTGRAA